MHLFLYISLFLSFLSAQLLTETHYCPLGQKPIKNGNTNKTECRLCLKCPAKYGVSDSCFNHKVVHRVECLHCDDGSYSASYNTEQCRPCRPKCGLNEHKEHNCTKRHNRECECKPGWVKGRYSRCTVQCCKCKTKKLSERVEECMELNIGKDCPCEEHIASTSISVLVKKGSIVLPFISKMIIMPSYAIFQHLSKRATNILQSHKPVIVLPTTTKKPTASVKTDFGKHKTITTKKPTASVKTDLGKHKTITTKKPTASVKTDLGKRKYSTAASYFTFLPTKQPSTTYDIIKNIHKKMDEGHKRIDHNTTIIVVIASVFFAVACIAYCYKNPDCWRSILRNIYRYIYRPFQCSYNHINFEEINLYELNLDDLLNAPKQMCFEDCPPDNNDMLERLEECSYFYTLIDDFLNNLSLAKMKRICEILFSEPETFNSKHESICKYIEDSIDNKSRILQQHIQSKLPFFTVNNFIYLLKAAGMTQSEIKRIHAELHLRASKFNPTYDDSLADDAITING